MTLHQPRAARAPSLSPRKPVAHRLESLEERILLQGTLAAEIAAALEAQGASQDAQQGMEPLPSLPAVQSEELANALQAAIAEQNQNQNQNQDSAMAVPDTGQPAVQVVGGPEGNGPVITGNELPESPGGLRVGLNPVPPSATVENLVQDIPEYPISFDGAYTSLWTAEQAGAVERDPSTTIPIVQPTEPDDLLPQFHMTDHWVVKNRDGSVAQINGYYMVVGLFYPSNVTGRVEEGVVNTYGYLFSEDGEEWQLGGVLVDPRDEDIAGDEFFSGSTMYDEDTDTLYVFTTNITGQVQSPSGEQPRQEIGLVQMRPVDGGPGLRFEKISSQILLDADNQYYATAEQAETGEEVYGFRDPVFFQDPRSGQEYLTFTANLANEPGDDSGVVGIAVAQNEDLTEWQLLPPLLAALDVNEQLERPHFTYMNDQYYLWFSTHARTFQGDLEGQVPDALYGFVGPNIWGPFYPLNETGLVLANPEAAPKQLYSFSVEKTSENTADVLSFVFNYIGGPGEDRFTYGGTPAPIMSIHVDGRETALSYIPAPDLAPNRAEGDGIVAPYAGFDPETVGNVELTAGEGEDPTNLPSGASDNIGLPAEGALERPETPTALPSAYLETPTVAQIFRSAGEGMQEAQEGSANPAFADDVFGLDPIAEGESFAELTQAERLPFGFEGWYMSHWLPSSLEEIELDETNTLPLTFPGEENIIDGYRMRDPAPVMTLDGELAQIDGYYVIFGETSPLGVAPTENPTGFLDNTYRYAISEDGEDWELGGVLLDPDEAGVPGPGLFAGSVRYDPEDEQVYIFYTSVSQAPSAEGGIPRIGEDGTPSSPSAPDQDGEDGQEGQDGQDGQATAGSGGATGQFPQPTQLMGLSIAEAVINGEPGLELTNYDHQGIILEPDGNFYVTAAEANTFAEVYGFRDPWQFRDPRSGEDYLLFVGNLADQDPRNDGVVGLAHATNEELTEWELLPPIFGAPGVNTQLELPHIVYQDGLYYLFFTTHDFTFIGDLQNQYPEGLYGFYAPNLWGPYYPLNESGLVLANPEIAGESAVEQQYAFRTFSAGDGTAVVYNFLNGPNTEGPLVRLLIEGDKTSITSVQAPDAPIGETFQGGAGRGAGPATFEVDGDGDADAGGTEELPSPSVPGTMNA